MKTDSHISCAETIEEIEKLNTIQARKTSISFTSLIIYKGAYSILKRKVIKKSQRQSPSQTDFVFLMKQLFFKCHFTLYMV